MVTATQLIEGWLDKRLAYKEIRPSTASTYRKVLKPFMADFAGTPLDKITPVHLRKWVVGLVMRKGTDHTHYVCTVLKNAFLSAVREDVILYSPWDKVDVPRAKREQRDVEVSTTEMQLLWGYAAKMKSHSNDKLAVLLALETGLRRGELAGLRWKDIQGPTVHVRHNAVIVDRKITLQAPKSTASKRVVTVSPTLVEILNEHRGEDDAFVLGGQRTPLHPETVSRMLAKAMRAIGAVNLTAHDFRHAHATHLLRKGVPVSAVARRLGHAKPTTTMSIYAHALKEDEDHIVEAIDNIFERG